MTIPESGPRSKLASSEGAVIICHNWYRTTIPSGENVVVERELALLKKHHIPHYELMRYNDELDKTSIFNKLAVLSRMQGTTKHRYQLQETLKQFPAAKVLHAHNVLPGFTYEIFCAAKNLGLTTIQTLHNYTLLGTNKYFYTLTGKHLPTTPAEVSMLWHMNPYGRNALLQTFYNRAYQSIWQKGYLDYVDKFICLNNFQRDIYIQRGFPAEKLVIKPNFTYDHITQLNQSDRPIAKLAYSEEVTEGNDYAIFVGRLSPEKGILPLYELWENLNIPLVVVGSGPLAPHLPQRKNIIYLGQKTNAETIDLISRARFLVMNSTWYEGFALVILEALSCGVPCLVPNLGPLPEIITNGQLGYVFDPDDSSDFTTKSVLLWEQAPTMRTACRNEYLAKYTPEENLKLLLNIY